MNIAILSPEYPPMTNWGGTATFNASLAKLLKHMGYTVHVITYDGIGVKEKNIKKDGIYIHYIRLDFPNKLLNFVYFTFPFGPVRNLLMKKIPKTIFSLEWNFFALLAFQKIQRTQHFRAIHTPPYSFPALYISAFYRKIQYIFHAHGAQRDFNKFEPLTKDNKIITCIEDFYMRHVPVSIVPCSTDTYRRIVTFFPQLKSKLFNIPNFLNTQSFKFKPNINPNNIIFNGQLNYRKGVDILIQAFVDVAKKNPYLKLFLIGRNGVGFTHQGNVYDFHSWFNKQVIPQNIKNRIFLFPQFDNQNNLFSFLQTLGGVIVVPSRYEPFGYVTIEAMALGLPVLATNNCGSRQIVTHGITGFLFKPDSKSLGIALNKMCKTNKHKLSKITLQARKMVESKYGIPAVEKQYKILYQTLLLGQ